MKSLYEAQVTAIGGRTGAAATADGRLRVDLSMPEELGGNGGEGVNPEQLFGLAYSACFLTALKSVASQSHIEIAPDTNVTATVGVAPRDNEEGLTLNVALLIDLPGLERDTAKDLVDRAHAICPYSDAMRRTVDVRLRVT